MDDLEQIARQRIGHTIGGRWHVQRVLGVGGMGAVYEVRDGSGFTAALKVLHPEMNRVSELRKRFLREAAVGNILSDTEAAPGIVRVLETNTDDDGSAFVVMEALVGEELFDTLRRERRLPVDRTLRMASDVLRVLAVAHDRGIVHRDLKPENLFVAQDGHLRVLDFGLARVLEAVPDGLDLPEITKTKTGVILGTAAYMAPEQALGVTSEIDGRTDLYSLGATMFRALAGRTPHGNLPLSQQVIAAATEPPPPLSTFAPDVPPWVAAVVDRALTFDRKQRYPDARHMLVDVEALLRGQNPPYVEGIAQRRYVPGQSTFDIAPAPPSGLLRPTTTVPDDSSDEPVSDEASRRTALLWILLAVGGGLILATAILAGIALSR